MELIASVPWLPGLMTIMGMEKYHASFLIMLFLRAKSLQQKRQESRLILQLAHLESMKRLFLIQKMLKKELDKGSRVVVSEQFSCNG